MSVPWLIILGPLAAAVAAVLLRRAAPALALLGALVAVAASWATLAAVAAGSRDAVSYTWLPDMPLRLSTDPLAALLSATVASVGFFVLLYALGYMASERSGDEIRFYAAMSLFLAAMQALVMAGDWLLLLGAWELIGLASYLLIGYWYQREEARAAASRAFLTTRGADIGLYLAVFVLITESGSSAVGETLVIGGPAATLVGFLLLLAAAGKAAQLPFQGWLAAAMAGPTPVSALLHSATLVAAGVILMLRAFPLLPPSVLFAMGALGGLTTVVAGLTALAQADLKRLLAASTSSQLGLMLLALAAGSPAAATFHLVAHAAMKSALFLGAGAFQHGRGSTDFERLRGAGREQRLAYAGFAVAGLALAGLPPLAGFWSKDAVLAAVFAAGAAWFLAPPALAGSLLTAGYIGRALRLLWQDRPAAEVPAIPGDCVAGRRRAGAWMGLGLAALAGASVLLGLLVGPLEELLAARLPASAAVMVLGLLVALAGLAAGWFLPAERMLGRLRPLAESGFRLGGGLFALTAQPALRLARMADRWDDAVHGLVAGAARRALSIAERASSGSEGMHRAVEDVAQAAVVTARSVRITDERGIEALIAAFARTTRDLGRAARRLQSGLVHRYLALTAGGVAGLLVLLVLRGLVR